MIKKQDERYDCGGADLRDLAAAAEASYYLGLGGASIDDEGSAEGGGSVGRGESDNVLIGIEVFVVTGRVDARGRRALRENHDGARAGN